MSSFLTAKRFIWRFEIKIGSFDFEHQTTGSAPEEKFTLPVCWAVSKMTGMLQHLGMGMAVGFLSGSIPFGYLAGRWRGIDIRQHGSGNIGATNVIRVLGKGIGIPTFALDLLKGLLPCLWIQSTGAPSWIWVLTGLAAILGHMFTPWLGFRGGKGVATAAGVLIGIAPLAVSVGLLFWLVTFFLTRYVSLASILAGVGVVVGMVGRMSIQKTWDPVLLSFGILLAILVMIRHRSNIGRILAGTEPKAGRSRESATKPGGAND